VAEKRLGVSVDSGSERGVPSIGGTRGGERGMVIKVRFKKVVNGGLCARTEKGYMGL
jgi:hypothetical protein